MILNALQFFHESAVRTKSNNSQFVARLEIKGEQEQQPDWQHANPNKRIWLYYREGSSESSCMNKGVHHYFRNSTETPAFGYAFNCP